MEEQALGAASSARGIAGPLARSIRGPYAEAVRRFRQNRLSVVGLSIIAFMLITAAIGPLFVPYPEDVTGAVHLDRRLQAPSLQHYFGTDEVGRDIFSRVIAGARISLGVGVIVLTVATAIGVSLGMVAGYFTGIVETIIMRLTDIFLTIPGLILAMAISAALGPSIPNVMLAISLVWWPGYCRLTRATVLAVKEQAFVEAARALGASESSVILRHVLPNAVSPVVIKASMDFGFAVLTTASLGFIGLGAQPPTPDWGKMLADGRRYLPESWWYSTFPGIAIFLTVLGFNLVGDGLRDILDPRLRFRAE